MYISVLCFVFKSNKQVPSFLPSSVRILNFTLIDRCFPSSGRRQICYCCLRAHCVGVWDILHHTQGLSVCYPHLVLSMSQHGVPGCGRCCAQVTSWSHMWELGKQWGIEPGAHPCGWLLKQKHYLYHLTLHPQSMLLQYNNMHVTCVQRYWSDIMLFWFHGWDYSRKKLLGNSKCPNSFSTYTKLYDLTPCSS